MRRPVVWQQAHATAHGPGVRRRPHGLLGDVPPCVRQSPRAPARVEHTGGRDLGPPTAAGCRAGLEADCTREALTEAREIRRATPHPSMAHRSGAHRLWPTAAPWAAAPPGGAWVAGRHL